MDNPSQENAPLANNPVTPAKLSKAEKKKMREKIVAEYRAKHAPPPSPPPLPRHPSGGFLDGQNKFFGKLFRFDLGNGEYRYLIGSVPQEAYCHPYYSDDDLLKQGVPPVLEEKEAVWHRFFSVNDRSVIAGAIIESDGKFGVLIRDEVFAMGVCRVGASSDPCVYDEIVFPNRMFVDQLGDSFGYLPVRKGGKWTVLLLAERKADMRMFSELAGPFEHPTAEAASEWAEKNKASFALGRVVSARPEG